MESLWHDLNDERPDAPPARSASHAAGPVSGEEADSALAQPGFPPAAHIFWKRADAPNRVLTAGVANPANDSAMERLGLLRCAALLELPILLYCTNDICCDCIRSQSPQIDCSGPSTMQLLLWSASA